ncbi:MAG: hypothetical protein R2818_14620 [Flavobacteriales bacterium]
MRISWNWLKQYIDTDLTPEQAAEILTSTGLETESVEKHEPIKGMLAGVVVGHVRSTAKHPDADRLTVCQVDLGNGEPVQMRVRRTERGGRSEGDGGHGGYRAALRGWDEHRHQEEQDPRAGKLRQ